MEEAYKAAIRLLAKRDYSRHKLTQKLIEKNFSRAEIDEALEKLVNERLFIEDNYTEARVRGLGRKGLAIRAIEQRLSEEKIHLADYEIEAILEEAGISPSNTLLQLVDKKLAQIHADDAFQKKLKLTRYLLSKGHDHSAIQSAISQLSLD